MTDVQNSRLGEMETNYDLRWYWLYMVGATTMFVFSVLFVSGFVLFTFTQAGFWAKAASVLIGFLVVAAFAYNLWVQNWKWHHWFLELDADDGAAWLHRPGSGTYFPYVVDKGVQYMPLRGAQVTKDEKKWYEQLIFKRSSTISLDGDAQDDHDFKNLRFIRDSWRIKNIIAAYTQRERELEHSQDDHLANIEASDARIVEQNDVLIAQNATIIELLKAMASALGVDPGTERTKTQELPPIVDEDEHHDLGGD